MSSEISKAEQLLKLVQTPEELLETTLEEMGKERSADGGGPMIDLQKILELKGLKKAEMDRMLDAMKDSVLSSAGGKNLRKMLNLGS